MYLPINLQLLLPDCFSSSTISYTSLETRNIGHTMLSLARKSLIILKEISYQSGIPHATNVVLFSIHLHFFICFVSQH